MVKLLTCCGYTVGNKNGNNNKIISLIDVSLALLYYIVSLVSLNISSISRVSILLNFFIVIRIIIKEVIEYRKSVDDFRNLHKISKNRKYNIHLYSRPYIIKIILGYFIILLMTIVIVSSTDKKYLIYLFSFGVLAVTLIEDIIYMLERLYNAKANISVYKKINL